MHNLLNTQLIPGLKLQSEDQFLITCLRTILTMEKDDELEKIDFSIIDWDLVFKKAIQWDIAPLLAKMIIKKSSLEIPNNFLYRIRMVYSKTFIANTKNFRELAKIIEAFNKAGIRVMILKGSHLAQFVYQYIGMRPMADIDILIKKEHLHRVEELLFQLGYDYVELGPATYNFRKIDKDTHGKQALINQFYKKHHHLHPFCSSKGIHRLEIHRDISPRGGPFSIDTEGLWRRAKSVDFNGSGSSIFCPEDLLLHLSLHASYYDKLQKNRLRVCCDMASTIKHHSDEIDWNKLQIRAHEWGAGKYLYLTLRLSKEILGANVPNDLLKALTPFPFNEKIFLESKKRILCMEPSGPTCKGMNHHAKITIFRHDEGLVQKVSFFINRIFISSEKLADRYSISASSKRVYFFHFVRFISLLYTYILVYGPYYLYKFVHKKAHHSRYNLDVWLASSDSKKNL